MERFGHFGPKVLTFYYGAKIQIETFFAIFKHCDSPLKSKQMIELLQLMNDKKKLKRPPRLPDPIRERSSLDNSHEKDLDFLMNFFCRHGSSIGGCSSNFCPEFFR